MEPDLPWPKIQREGLLGFAVEHWQARGLSLPEEIRQLWLGSIVFEMRCRQVLEQISDLRVPALVFKGCSLALHVYPRPGLRPCGDIDLAALPEHRPALREGLEQLGFQESSGGQYHRSGLVVDLHEHPLHQLTELVGPKSTEFWSQAKPLWPARPFLRRLSLAHEFILTLFHGSKHAFSRAAWLVDAALLSRQVEPESLAEAVCHFRAGRLLAYAQECLRFWFDWEFPAALQAVIPGRLSWLERRFLTLVRDRRAPDFLGMLTPVSCAHHPWAAMRFLLRSLYPHNSDFGQRSRQLLRMANALRESGLSPQRGT